VGSLHAHLGDQVAPEQSGQGPRPLGEARAVPLLGRDDAFLRAVVTQVTGERTGVDSLDADDPVLAQVGVERDPRAPARGVGTGFLDDEPAEPGAARLDVLQVDPVVADEIICPR
jgi:hypothetical protein